MVLVAAAVGCIFVLQVMTVESCGDGSGYGCGCGVGSGGDIYAGGVGSGMFGSCCGGVMFVRILGVTQV